MRWKQIESAPRAFALIFETGDEIAAVLQQFAKAQSLAGSSFKAIGALSYAKLGWFNLETKKYDPACVLDEQVELLSLIGDCRLMRNGGPLRSCGLRLCACENGWNCGNNPVQRQSNPP
jgi:predicted DNA-binding protein with PD1-like motif